MLLTKIVAITILKNCIAQNNQGFFDRLKLTFCPLLPILQSLEKQLVFPKAKWLFGFSYLVIFQPSKYTQ